MILQIAFDLPSSKLYDYFGLPDQPLPAVGSRVLAQLGPAQRLGIVCAVAQSSSLPLVRINPIDRLLDAGQPILPASLLAALTQFASSHLLPLNKLVFAALPPPARRSKKDLPAPQLSARAEVDMAASPELPGAQRRAIARLGQADRFHPYLVCGPPASGKLAMALAAIGAVVARGRTCLVLVPELAAIRPLVARLAELIPGIVCQVMHGELADGERLKAWHQAGGGACHVLIGTRVAAYTPLDAMGLVCVINENDPLHRSEHGLGINARDLGASRALQAGCPLLMLAATLSLELRLAARQGRATLTMLAEPEAAPKATVRVIDVARRRLAGGVSNEMENALRLQLREGGLSVVLTSRRGQGGTLYCPECRTVLRCRSCRLGLALEEGGRCVCRRCGHSQPAPSSCPACGGGELAPLRPGSARVAEVIQTRIPEARIVKLDGLTPRQEQLDAKAGDADIVVGTKLMLGLDLKAGLCVISDADSILLSPSFRSAEMLHDTVIKVKEKFAAPTVLVQTHFAKHHVFSSLTTGSYDSFALTELAEREGAGLPPYRRLGLFRAYGGDAAAVAQAAGTARFLAQQQMGKQVSLMDLVAVAQPKGACTQFLLSFAKREASLEHIRSWQGELAANLKSRAVRWSFELDPQSW